MAGFGKDRSRIAGGRRAPEFLCGLFSFIYLSSSLRPPRPLSHHCYCPPLSSHHNSFPCFCFVRASYLDGFWAQRQEYRAGCRVRVGWYSSQLLMVLTLSTDHSRASSLVETYPGPVSEVVPSLTSPLRSIDLLPRTFLAISSISYSLEMLPSLSWTRPRRTFPCCYLGVYPLHVVLLSFSIFSFVPFQRLFPSRRCRLHVFLTSHVKAPRGLSPALSPRPGPPILL